MGKFEAAAHRPPIVEFILPAKARLLPPHVCNETMGLLHRSILLTLAIPVAHGNMCLFIPRIGKLGKHIYALRWHIHAVPQPGKLEGIHIHRPFDLPAGVVCQSGIKAVLIGHTASGSDPLAKKRMIIALVVAVMQSQPQVTMQRGNQSLRNGKTTSIIMCSLTEE